MKDYCGAFSSVIYLRLEAQQHQTRKGLEMRHSLPQQPLIQHLANPIIFASTQKAQTSLWSSSPQFMSGIFCLTGFGFGGML